MTTFDLITGSDHRGHALKCAIEQHVVPHHQHITSYQDCGCHDADIKVDYPDIVHILASALKGAMTRGILVCGSGFGVAIAANRYPHVRAVTVRSAEETEIARRHNDANVLCLGADFTQTNDAKMIVDAFLTTEFDGGRHQHRVAMLTTLPKIF